MSSTEIRGSKTFTVRKYNPTENNGRHPLQPHSQQDRTPRVYKILRKSGCWGVVHIFLITAFSLAKCLIGHFTNICLTF